MNAFEHWFFRVADSDANWMGLSWLRPAKERRVGLNYILLSSAVLSVPGILVAAGLLYLFMGRVDPGVFTWIVALCLFTELVLHITFARLWNKRAVELLGSKP